MMSRWLVALAAATLATSGLAVVAPAAAHDVPGALSAIQELDASATDCSANEVALNWGFKEAFRSYISSSIAKGEWTVDDGATYETPLFGWANGDGVYDGDTGEGLLTLHGSVRFFGHGGVLDTTISNPQLRFDGDGAAMLLLDVQGDTQGGETVNRTGVEFAAIDLNAAKTGNSGGELEFADAPATLTAAGSVAFGTYPEGEALDPVTIAFTAVCAGSEDGGLWLIATIVAAAGLVAVTFVLIRRRKQA